MHLPEAEAEAASLPCEHLSFMLQLRNEITQKMQSEEHKGLVERDLRGELERSFRVCPYFYHSFWESFVDPFRSQWKTCLPQKSN